jgi:hypothetical protein
LVPPGWSRGLSTIKTPTAASTNSSAATGSEGMIDVAALQKNSATDRISFDWEDFMVI